MLFDINAMVNANDPIVNSGQLVHNSTLFFDKWLKDMDRLKCLLNEDQTPGANHFREVRKLSAVETKYRHR
ncbi:unnamed protein product [Medioppia subpectinata]|uniref:Uncharacterized protein n=1 Tax=Medioppia subpectinata TaxID=1979941 RepID=A0A7R9Q5E0_9ACAR|nr:unnamed protein product [Medioppia subpectinata]CAG2113346.1 unnamed protein product [Medioppia subpectinata]